MAGSPRRAAVAETPRRRRSPARCTPRPSPRCRPSTAATPASSMPCVRWLSEFGLMRCRVRVEVEWFIALASAGLAELAPPGPAAHRVPEPPGRRLLGRRRRGDQGDRAAHQPRRQGGRVLAGRALRRRAVARRRDRLHPLRVHQRGHQQHQPRADARGGAARGPAAGASTRSSPASPRSRKRARRAADAGAHARPDGDADDARQGDRQRRGAPGPGARRHRRGRAARQDERRRRQLQRARRRLSRRSTGRRSRAASSRTASASPSTRTRRRSSRTTRWPSCSTRSSAATRS